MFSEKEKLKTNSQIQSEYDKRINDLLHKIEFTDATPAQAYKMYMKLQGFLRKKRAVKNAFGKIYTPRTETGNYIINGKVTDIKKEDTNGGNRRRNKKQNKPFSRRSRTKSKNQQ